MMKTRKTIPLLPVLLLSGIFSFHSQSMAQVSKLEATNLVQEFLKCWESNDSQSFENAMHEDMTFAYPGDRLSKQEAVEMFKEFQTQKKDIKIYLWDQMILQNDRFATAYQFAATDIETGKRQAVGTGVTGKIKNGKIILFKEYYDEDVAIMQYENELPLDEGDVSPWPASVWLKPETID